MLNLLQELGVKKNKSYIFSNGRNFTYENLVQDAAKFNSYNADQSLVFIIANNSYECLVGYIGLLSANATLALINDSIN